MTEQRITTARRRFAGNFASILTSDILHRGTTFLIYILVARELGTIAFGQMSLALTFFYSFQVIAIFGMQTLITREVAKSPEQSSRYFVCGSLVSLAGSALSMLLLGVTIILLGYSPETSSLIFLSSLALLPFALGAVCEAIVRGWEQMHLIAIAKVPVNLFKVAATLAVLYNGGSIFQIILIIVVSHFAVFFVLLAAVVWKMERWKPRSLDFAFTKSIVRRSTTFVGIDTVIAWLASTNIVILSKMQGEADTGLYNAAAQLMIPLTIFFQSVMISAFPIMCRKYAAGTDGLDRVANKLIGLLLTLAIPGAVGLIILAETALVTVYAKEEFILAASVLRITAFIIILRACTFALGHVLLAGGREKTTFRIVLVNLVVLVFASWILIGQFGLIGAAVAALIMRIVDFAQHYGPARQVINQIEFVRIAWKPIVATAVMAAFLLLVPEVHLALSIVAGALVYFCVLVAIEACTSGGLHVIRARYL